MGKAGTLFIVLLLADLGRATAQVIPNPPPDPRATDVAAAQYPSAKACGVCHPKQYEQWRISSHAYANLSPMFNKFEQTINNLSQGTVSYFCVRCHASVGTALGERRDIAWWDRTAAAREGITCVTCHRVGEAYGKNNSARRITPGEINEPVFGPFDTKGVIKAVTNAAAYGIAVNPNQADQPGVIRIHQQAIRSNLIEQSEFCMTCHQVQVHPGIKLETVWEEYRASPAKKEGITCQQCHMSPSPGQKVPFEQGYAAIVNGHTFNETRNLTDHRFIGPGYPISHPGLFPIDHDSPFTPQQWLKFDYRAEWGSDAFEKNVPPSDSFPPEWRNPADRKTAWEIVARNRAAWDERKKLRVQLLENGSSLNGPYFDSRAEVGKPFSFHYTLKNLNKGHNLPSGSLGAQPELWLNVALIGPGGGKPIWESGYVDSYGDVADVESRDVRARKIDFDAQLFNMQAKFITTNLKGTDREMYLPINLDFDQLPFIRPGGAPTSLLNHPPNARMEKHSIPPLGTREARYTVPAEKMVSRGKYRLAIRMRGRTEPIYFMDFVSATTDMKRAENDWVTDTHVYAVEFEVH
jgi:nitrate/TMAO reductase-like tetraheme cytochrome c subunit